ncbi:cytochrome P450 [Sphingoaurantiacus capsulatus]|uniref:Cytochrome P450 n=1 Tax=Sphingoaurantiacus capsulatus TaxID=1771310 RepID=A0ABV7XB79_9SPHN
MADNRPTAPREAFDPDYFAANGYPHDVWAKLRAEAPVAWYDDCIREPFWAITRYADIMTVGRDAQTFINAKGVTILRKDQMDDQAMANAVPLLLTMDPPKHGKQRGVLRDRFRPNIMAALDEHIRKRCHEIADDVAARRLSAAADADKIDFVDAIAMRLPLDVILELLGVPTSDRDQMYIWSNAVIGSEDPEYGNVEMPRDAIMAARMGIFGYFSKFIAERRAKPGEDLVSLLCEARVDGEALTDIEVLGYCFLLMLAGNETTRNATSGAMLALIENPAAMQQLRDNPELMPTAVEELLRWVAPIVYMARSVAKDTEIGGQKIAAGEKVVMFYPSANRDESVFENPTHMDLTRTPNEHLTFGFGRHRCLGNDLARIELRAVMTEVLRRFPEISLAGPVSRLRSNFVGGIKHMPVRLG